MSIGSLVESYGYLAVFVLVGAESLGIPLPGETALITASIYAGHTHRLNPWLIFLVAAARLIQDVAASSAASMTRPAVASLTQDVRQEVTALSAGLASAAHSPGSRGLPGQPA